MIEPCIFSERWDTVVVVRPVISAGAHCAENTLPARQPFFVSTTNTLLWRLSHDTPWPRSHIGLSLAFESLSSGRFSGSLRIACSHSLIQVEVLHALDNRPSTWNKAGTKKTPTHKTPTQNSKTAKKEKKEKKENASLVSSRHTTRGARANTASCSPFTRRSAPHRKNPALASRAHCSNARTHPPKTWCRSALLAPTSKRNFAPRHTLVPGHIVAVTSAVDTPYR